jgi:hypothetical protein
LTILFLYLDKNLRKYFQEICVLDVTERKMIRSLYIFHIFSILPLNEGVSHKNQYNHPTFGIRPTLIEKEKDNFQVNSVKIFSESQK